MRTHWCGELRASDAGVKVRLAGWVHRRRDHGGVIFLDLRDREGLVQIVVHPDEGDGAYESAGGVRAEYVLLVEGTVRPRPAGTANPNLPSGEIEVSASSLEVISESETPPFPIEDRTDASEEVRLKYRYLDLRRPQMLQVLMLRHRTIAAIRRYFDDNGFVEVETPLLNKSTPEGARDYLVPSRLQPGTFFALQQSPQLFKQLLMIAGLERYYQIVRCFRDEDPRADRQPDFTQLDVEMAFVDEEVIFGRVEEMMSAVFKAALGVDVQIPFPRMPYADALERYGTDKPDLRFGLEMQNVTPIFDETGVHVFRKVLEAGGSAHALGVSGGDRLDRKALDGLTRVARSAGASGLAWILFTSDGISSPLGKALSQVETEGLRLALQLAPGDLALVVCDKQKVARRALGEVRLALADLLDLRPAVDADDPRAWRFAWITEAPLVEYNERESRWDPTHHPFTAPLPGDEHLLDRDPGAVRARAYDVVLNGWELAGGSIRIHRPDLQRRVFDLIGLDPGRAERRFGWFVKAFDYGAPPHGGIAMGIDRFVALLAEKENIREVIAFPKTSAMTDIMTGAPDRVDGAQLRELHIRTTVEDAE